MRNKFLIGFFLIVLLTVVHAAEDVFIFKDVNVVSGLETDDVVVSGSFQNLVIPHNIDATIGIEIVNAKGFTVYTCCTPPFKTSAINAGGINYFSGSIAPTNPFTFPASDSPYYAKLTISPGVDGNLLSEAILGNNSASASFTVSKPIVQNIPETNQTGILWVVYMVLGIIYRLSKSPKKGNNSKFMKKN